MGFKKVILKNYTGEDMGFRIPSQRKFKDGHKSKNLSSTSNRNSQQIPLTDDHHSLSKLALKSSAVNDNKERLEKRIDRLRRNQRFRKYEQENALEFVTDSEDDSDSARKPSPSSPPTLWKPSKELTPLRTKIVTQSENATTTSGAASESPFRKHLSAGLLSPEKMNLSIEGKIDNQDEYDGNEVVSEETFIRRCATTFYALLYPQLEKSSKRNKRWDDADSDDEGGDIVISESIIAVDRNWFTNTFLDMILQSKLSHKLFDAIQSINDPSYHVMHDFIDEIYVLNSFLVSSDYFVSALVEAIIHEDDRVTSQSMALLQVIYKSDFCSDQSATGRIRNSIVSALYIAVNNRAVRCTASEKLSRIHEVDVNNLASQKLLQFVDTFDNAETQSVVGCDANKPIAKPNIGEESTGYKISDHFSTVIQLLKFLLLFEARSASSNASITTRYSYFIKIVVNLFRCYGSPLGAVSGVLENPLQLSNLIACHSQLVHLISLSIDRRDELLNELLTDLLRYWSKSMYIRELAFIDASMVVLTACRPQMLRGQQQTISNYEKGPCLPACKAPVEKILRRILSSSLSTHFKVAHRSIQVLQSHFVLESFFLVRDDDDENVSSIKELLMGTLIQNLRSNRSHWHPMVKQVASTAFENVYQYFA